MIGLVIISVEGSFSKCECSTNRWHIPGVVSGCRKVGIDMVYSWYHCTEARTVAREKIKIAFPEQSLLLGHRSSQFACQEGGVFFLSPPLYQFGHQEVEHPSSAFVCLDLHVRRIAVFSSIPFQGITEPKEMFPVKELVQIFL